MHSGGGGNRRNNNNNNGNNANNNNNNYQMGGQQQQPPPHAHYVPQLTVLPSAATPQHHVHHHHHHHQPPPPSQQQMPMGRDHNSAVYQPQQQQPHHAQYPPGGMQSGSGSPPAMQGGGYMGGPSHHSPPVPPTQHNSSGGFGTPYADPNLPYHMTQPQMRPPSPYVQQPMQQTSLTSYPSSGPASPYPPPAPVYGQQHPLSVPGAPSGYSSQSNSAATTQMTRSNSSSVYAPPPPNNVPLYPAPTLDAPGFRQQPPQMGGSPNNAHQQHPQQQQRQMSSQPSTPYAQPPQHGFGGTPPMPNVPPQHAAYPPQQQQPWNSNQQPQQGGMYGAELQQQSYNAPPQRNSQPPPNAGMQYHTPAAQPHHMQHHHHHQMHAPPLQQQQQQPYPTRGGFDDSHLSGSGRQQPVGQFPPSAGGPPANNNFAPYAPQPQLHHHHHQHHVHQHHQMSLPQQPQQQPPQQQVQTGTPHVQQPPAHLGPSLHHQHHQHHMNMGRMGQQQQQLPPQQQMSPLLNNNNSNNLMGGGSAYNPVNPSPHPAHALPQQQQPLQQQQQRGPPPPAVGGHYFPTTGGHASSLHHRPPKPSTSPQPQQPTPNDIPLSPAAQRLTDAGYHDDELIGLLDRYQLLETIGLADYLAEVRERRKAEPTASTRTRRAAPKPRNAAEQPPTKDAFCSDNSDSGEGAEDAFGSDDEDDNPFREFLMQEKAADTITIAIDLHYLLARLCQTLQRDDPLWFVRSPVPHRLLALVKDEVNKLRDFDLEPLFVMQGLWPVGDVETYRIPKDVLDQRGLVWQALATQRYPPDCLQLELDQVFDTQQLSTEADRAVSQYIQHELGATVVVAPYLNWAQMSMLRAEGAVQLLYGPAAALMLQDERLEMVLDINLDDQMSGQMIVVRRSRVLEVLFPNIMSAVATNNSFNQGPPQPLDVSDRGRKATPQPQAEAEQQYHAQCRAGDRLMDLFLLGTTYPSVQALHTQLTESVFELHRELSADPPNRKFMSLKDLVQKLYHDGLPPGQKEHDASANSAWLRHARARCYVRHNVVLSLRNPEMPIGYHSRCIFRCYHPDAAAQIHTASGSPGHPVAKTTGVTSHHPYGSVTSTPTPQPVPRVSILPPLVSQPMLGVFGNMPPVSLLLMQFCGVLSVGCLTALVHTFVADVGPPCDSDEYRDTMSMVMMMWTQVLYQLVRDTSACTDSSPKIAQSAHETFMAIDDEGRTLSTTNMMSGPGGAGAAPGGGGAPSAPSGHNVFIVAPGEGLPASSRNVAPLTGTFLEKLHEISWVRWFEPFQEPIKPADLIVLDDWNVAGQIDPVVKNLKQMQLHHVLDLHSCAVGQAGFPRNEGRTTSRGTTTNTSAVVLEAYAVILLRSFDLLGYFTHVASTPQGNNNAYNGGGGGGGVDTLPSAGSGLGHFVQHVRNVAKADPVHGYSYVLLVELLRTESISRPPLHHIPHDAASSHNATLDPFSLACRIACALSLKPTTEGPQSVPPRRWLPIYQRPLGAFMTIAAMNQRALRELVEVSAATYYLRKRKSMTAEERSSSSSSNGIVETKDLLALLPHLPFAEQPNAHGAMLLFYALQVMEATLAPKQGFAPNLTRRQQVQALARDPTARAARMHQLQTEFACIFADVSSALLETITFVLYGVYVLRGCLQCPDDIPNPEHSQLNDELAYQSQELVVDAWTLFYGGEEMIEVAQHSNNKQGKQHNNHNNVFGGKSVPPLGPAHGSVVDALSLLESFLLNQ